MSINGEIVKRYVYRGKIVIVCRIETEKGDVYSFKITDKAKRQDYFNNTRYANYEDCERDAYKVVKAI